jgi:hypothetical protein
MSHFKIEKLNYRHDWSDLQDFFKKVYSSNHILTNQEFFEWQFVKSGFQNWIVKKDEQIVGHVGIINPKFVVKNQLSRVGFWACLVVLEEMRNHGLGVFLNREIENEMDIVYSTGINAEGIKLFKGLNWTDVVNLYRWVKVPHFEGETGDVVEIKEFNRVWDESWKLLRKRYPITINRTSEYLNWRFINHPKTKYQVFGIKAKEGYDGYIVLRMEEGEIRAVRIVDFIAKNEQAEKELLKAAIQHAHENKVDFLDFLCSSKMYAKSLKDLGFNDADSETPIFILPIDNNRKHIKWAYKIINPELKNLQTEDWFIVKADGDKDRPQS